MRANIEAQVVVPVTGGLLEGIGVSTPWRRAAAAEVPQILPQGCAKHEAVAQAPTMQEEASCSNSSASPGSAAGGVNLQGASKKGSQGAHRDFGRARPGHRTKVLDIPQGQIVDDGVRMAVGERSHAPHGTWCSTSS